MCIFFIFFTIQSSHISQESSHSQESDYINYFIVWQPQIEWSSIESRCEIYTFFTNVVFVSFLLLLLLQSAANTSSFKRETLLSFVERNSSFKRDHFHVSACFHYWEIVVWARRSREEWRSFYPSHQISKISALVQALFYITDLCFLEATIGQIRCHSTLSEPVWGVLEASVCAFSVRFRSDGVALWEMLFLVCFEDGEWRKHMRPG